MMGIMQTTSRTASTKTATNRVQRSASSTYPKPSSRTVELAFGRAKGLSSLMGKRPWARVEHNEQCQFPVSAGRNHSRVTGTCTRPHDIEGRSQKQTAI